MTRSGRRVKPERRIRPLNLLNYYITYGLLVVPLAPYIVYTYIYI